MLYLSLIHGLLSIQLLFILICTPVFGQNSESMDAQFRAAEAAFQNQAWNRALDLYENLAQAFDDHPQAHVGVGESAMRLKAYTKAITAYHRALELLPERPKIQGRLADAYLKNNQLNKADKWYKQAIANAGDTAPVSWYNNLGFIETGRGNYEQARRYYIVAVQLHPKATTAYYNLATVLLKLNRLDEADAAFYAALEQDEVNTQAIFGRGQVAAARRNLDEAHNFYQRALKLDVNNSTFHYALAQVLFRLGALDAGQKTLDRYRQTKAQLYVREARQLVNQKRWREALAKLQKAVEVDATSPDALQKLAYVQMQVGDFEAAKQRLLLGLQMSADAPQVHFYLGLAEVRLGNLKSAESAFLAFIQQSPDSLDGYTQLARVREMQGDFAGAEAAYDMGINKDHVWAPGYWWRGEVRQKGGKGTGAESDFRRAIALAPKAPFPKNALARLFVEENRNLDEALKLANAALSDAPTPQYRATLASIYFRLNRIQDALKEIEHAYQDAPDDAEVRAIRAKIRKAWE